MATSVWITMLVLGVALMMLATVRVRRTGALREPRGTVAGHAVFKKGEGKGLIPRVLAPASLAASLCCSACVGTGFPSFLGLGSTVLDELRSHDRGAATPASKATSVEPAPEPTAALSAESVMFGLLALLTAQAGLAPLLTRWMREPTGALGVIAATMIVLLLGSVLPAAVGLGAYVLGRVREDNRPSKDPS